MKKEAEKEKGISITGVYEWLQFFLISRQQFRMKEIHFNQAKREGCAMNQLQFLIKVRTFWNVQSHDAIF